MQESHQASRSVAFSTPFSKALAYCGVQVLALLTLMK